MATQPIANQQITSGSSGTVTLSSAAVQIYINGKAYNQAISISWNIDYGLSPKHGIDSVWAQDIADGKGSVNIRITAICTAFDAGVAKYNARAIVTDVLQSPYSSIRVVNRANSDTLLYVPNCRVANENFDGMIKQTAKYSFSLMGLVPYNGLDLAYSNS